MRREPFVIIIPTCNKLVGGGYWNQVVCPSVCRQNGSQTFSVSLSTKSHHIMHMVYLLHLGQKGKGQAHWTSKQRYCVWAQENYPFCLDSLYHTWDRSIYGFRVPEHYPFYLESLYHTYILMRRRCCLSNFRSKVKCTGHQSSNMISRLFSIILSTQNHHIIHMNSTMGQRCSLLNFWSKGQRSSSLDIKVAIWFSFKILEQPCEIEMTILCI